MKNIRTLYRIVTGVAAAFMTMASIPDVLRDPQAIAIFNHLGYPAYLLPFLGTAKLLGVGALLVPGCRRLKEWAYAGLVFDLSGALYSHVSVGDPPSVWVFPLVGLCMIAGSYLLRAASFGIFVPSSQSASTTRRASSAGPEVANVRRN